MPPRRRKPPAAIAKSFEGCLVKGTDNKVKLVPVETGIADNTHIEIKKGVKAGDEVVSGSYSAISRKLKDGMVVQIEKPKKEEEKK